MFTSEVMLAAVKGF
jgi:hypothetical protein